MIQSNQPSNHIQSFLTTYSQQIIPQILTYKPLENTSIEETPNDETPVTFEESFTEDNSSDTCYVPSLLMVDPSPAQTSNPHSSQT